MSNRLRIAFGHKARSGKDTSAEYIVGNYGGVSLRFAEGVYDIAFDIQRRLGIVPRKDPALLQWVGDGLRKLYGANVWCDRVERQIEGNSAYNIVIADMRYPNEAEMLRRKGFTLINITRKDRPIDRDPNHSSEVALDNYPHYDYVIANDGTVEDLYAKLDDVVAKLRNDEETA